MSVTICWRPTSDSGFHFKSGTAADLGKLNDVFSGYIPNGSGAILRAMGVAAGNPEFYNEVADAVDKHGAIKIWGEW